MQVPPRAQSRPSRTGQLFVIWGAVVCGNLLALEGQAEPPASPFRFIEVNENKSLKVEEDHRPILVYNHGPQHPKGAPLTEARNSYIHPLYGLDGEVLTDDAPTDHLHHRGVFWAWPHVTVDGRHHDGWMMRGIVPRFERWTAREAGPDAARLGVENGWYVGMKKVMREQLMITVRRASTRQGSAEGRAIDLSFTWTPEDTPITLGGAKDKSYGGLTIRFAAGSDTEITVPSGRTKEDLYMTSLPWADLTCTWDRERLTSGVALFVHPSHPDYPPTWLTRHYGVLCLGWPGVEPKTLVAGDPVHCRYRIWIHSRRVDADLLGKVYADYLSKSARVP
jgi:hypothetical protein